MYGWVTRFGRRLVCASCRCPHAVRLTMLHLHDRPCGAGCIAAIPALCLSAVTCPCDMPPSLGSSRLHPAHMCCAQGPYLSLLQVTAIDSSKPGSIAVAVQGRGTLSAQHVVVAVPLGVLQKGAIRFLPSGLAPANKAALGQLGMGLLNKVGWEGWRMCVWRGGVGGVCGGGGGLWGLEVGGGGGGHSAVLHCCVAFQGRWGGTAA